MPRSTRLSVNAKKQNVLQIALLKLVRGSVGRIRTYNFPQNRISDHRINYTTYNLDRVLEGHLEDVQQALIDDAKSAILGDLGWFLLETTCFE